MPLVLRISPPRKAHGSRGHFKTIPEKYVPLLSVKLKRVFSYIGCGTWHPEHLNWTSIVSGYAPPILDCIFRRVTWSLARMRKFSSFFCLVFGF
jgi:hypothetical protein